MLLFFFVFFLSFGNANCLRLCNNGNGRNSLLNKNRYKGTRSVTTEMHNQDDGKSWASESLSELSQDELMYYDECIVVDSNDKIVGHSTKYKVHKFCSDAPNGILHRAFSVFLFNMEGKLLLQQRAAGKITFPNVWTNSCCSHPLFGFAPNEFDDDEAVSMGRVPGIKYAAIRKLEHELGITDQLKLEDFKYLTRLHYCAADTTSTAGKDCADEMISTWGEHEIDYILFVRANVTIRPNEDEVQNLKYVSYEELKQMMVPSSGLLWSPWFRIIAETFLVKWWEDLDKTLLTNQFVDLKSIHKFACNQIKNE